MKRAAAMIECALRAAMRAAEHLPPADKADVYEGIGHAAKRARLPLAEYALSLSKALRDAEGLQLYFRHWAGLTNNSPTEGHSGCETQAAAKSDRMEQGPRNPAGATGA